MSNVFNLDERTRKAEERAARLKRKQATRNKATDAGLRVSESGECKVTLDNMVQALVSLGITGRHDTFRDKCFIRGDLSLWPGDETEVNDRTCLHLRVIIEREYMLAPGREVMQDATENLCLANPHNPVTDYLDGLRWDGRERLGTWLHDFAGAPDTELNRAIGRIMLIAQVRRARQPGCKFDTIAVLEGAEGTRKSSLLAALAGQPDLFSDQTLLGLADREAQEILAGKWITEVADLAGMRKAEVEQVKAFASRTEDRARPAYGRCTVSRPRTGVIWATTNNHDYLRSQTGNRRFMPIVTGRIRLEEFIASRDQLLAEAARAECVGESIVLPEVLWPEARAAADLRREVDPWEDVLEHTTSKIVPAEGGELRVHAQQLLLLDLGVPVDRQTDYHFKRLGSVMRRLGWEGPRLVRVDGKQARGYARVHA